MDPIRAAVASEDYELLQDLVVAYGIPDGGWELFVSCSSEQLWHALRQVTDLEPAYERAQRLWPEHERLRVLDHLRDSESRL